MGYKISYALIKKSILGETTLLGYKEPVVNSIRSLIEVEHIGKRNLEAYFDVIREYKIENNFNDAYFIES